MNNTNYPNWGESEVVSSLKNSNVDSLTISSIQRLYSDQDELVCFIDTLKNESTIRENKLKDVIFKLSEEIRKFKQQNIDQHNREQILRSLCETMLSRDNDIENEKRESEDVTKVLQVLLHSSNNSNIDHIKKTHDNTIDMSSNSSLPENVFLYNTTNLDIPNYASPKSTRTTFKDTKQSQHELNAQLINTNRDIKMLENRLYQAFKENEMLRDRMHVYKQRYSQVKWEKQQQRLLLCAKQIETMTKEKEKAEKEKQANKQYTMKLETEVVKLKTLVKTLQSDLRSIKNKTTLKSSIGIEQNSTSMLLDSRTFLNENMYDTSDAFTSAIISHIPITYDNIDESYNNNSHKLTTNRHNENIMYNSNRINNSFISSENKNNQHLRVTQPSSHYNNNSIIEKPEFNTSTSTFHENDMEIDSQLLVQVTNDISSLVLSPPKIKE